MSLQHGRPPSDAGTRSEVAGSTGSRASRVSQLRIKTELAKLKATQVERAAAARAAVEAARAAAEVQAARDVVALNELKLKLKLEEKALDRETQGQKGQNQYAQNQLAQSQHAQIQGAQIQDAQSRDAQSQEAQDQEVPSQKALGQGDQEAGPALETYPAIPRLTSAAAPQQLLQRSATSDLPRDNARERTRSWVERLSTEPEAEGPSDRRYFMESSLPKVKQVPAEDYTSGTRDLDLDPSARCQKALGVVWNVPADTFIFRSTDDDTPVTKRGILSAVSSVFDPLGMLAPWTLRDKCLIQSIWQSGCHWDEPLTDQSLTDAWTQRAGERSQLEQFEIRRCYRDGGKHPVNCQLHAFCDASELAFGAVAYFRLEHEDGTVSTVFVLAKKNRSPRCDN